MPRCEPSADEKARLSLFAASLNNVLDERGMDYGELATAVSVLPRSAYRWTKGERRPTVGMLVRIERALQPSADGLLLLHAGYHGMTADAYRRHLGLRVAA